MRSGRIKVGPASYPDVSLDVRAKEGGRETTGETAVCTLPMVPCGVSPVTRFALASAMRKTKRLRRRLRLGGETSAPLFIFKCVMRSRTGTSALSAFPVRLKAGEIFLSVNRKSYFLSVISGYNVHL